MSFKYVNKSTNIQQCFWHCKYMTNIGIYNSDQLQKLLYLNQEDLINPFWTKKNSSSLTSAYIDTHEYSELQSHCNISSI